MRKLKTALKEKSGATANLTLDIETEVRDKDGNLISTHKQTSKSLLKNFALALRALMYGNISSQIATIKDMSEVNRTYPHASGINDEIFNCNALVTDSLFGVLCGKGTTAVTRDDWKLSNQMTHGSTIDKLSYGATSVEAPDGAPPITTWRILRTFTNNYSASQTVYEVALAFHFTGYGAASWYFLIARDVLATPQAIPVGATLIVRYIFSVTA